MKVGTIGKEFDEAGKSLRWLVLPAIAAGAFADYYNTAGVITPGADSYLPYFHATTAQYGFFVLLLNIGLMIGALSWGHLVDVFGRRKMFLVDLIFMGIFVIASVFAETFTEFIIFRVLVGVAIGGDYTAALPLLAEVVPSKNRGSYMALYWIIAESGLVVGSSVSYAFLAVTHLSPTIWRYLLLTGLIPIVIALIARAKMPESTRWLLSKNKIEEARDTLSKANLTHTMDENQLNEAAKIESSRRNSLYYVPILIASFVGIYFVAMPAGLATYFFPTILHSLGINKLESVLFIIPFVWVPEIVFNVILALSTDRFGRLKTLGISGIFLGIFTFSISLVTHNIPVLLLFIFISGGLSVLTQDIIINWGPELFPTKYRARSTGSNIVAFRLSLGTTGIFEPFFVSLGGVPALYVFLGVVSFVGTAVGFFGVGKKGKSEKKTLEELQYYVEESGPE